MELEKNERLIEPIITWANSGQKAMTIFKLYNLSNYTFEANAGAIAHWALQTVGEEEKESVDAEGSMTVEVIEVKQTLVHGNVELPSDLVSSWGEDDEPIFQYVMQQINITPV